MNTLLLLALLGAPTPTPCQLCAVFNETREPFRVFGNTRRH